MNQLQITFLSLLALTLTGCGDGSNKPTIVNKYDIYTDTIRGHVYLHVYGGGILHDPDCPCREKGGNDATD